MIMDVGPTRVGQPEGPWKAWCGRCRAPMKNTYRDEYHARKAAAAHLWAHRTQGVLTEKDRTQPSSGLKRFLRQRQTVAAVSSR